MTFPTPQVQADGVKHALTSLATCTSSTVSTLNQLLFTKPRPCTDQQNQTTRVAVRATTAGTKTRPGTTKKTRVKAKVTILEISEEKELAACEKFTLATEVCNASIKLLSEAVKSPSQFRRQSTTKDVNHSPKSTAGIRPMPRSVSALQQPLQTLPVNRVSSSPDTSPILRRSSSCASIGPAAGLVATAQCAQLGFAALRSLHAQGIEQAGSSALRLENGMLAFTGKLIDLGIDDMAIKELRILKKRLYTMKGAVDKEMNRGQASLPEKETLASILRFEGVNAEEPELGLMIGVQLHALRLIASRKQYRLIEDVVDNLTLSLSGSPADLILKSLRQDTPPKVAKAARQLETLAQSLLALCPKTPSADDASAPQIVAAVSPRTIFRAQALAFEIRLQWWGLAAHDVNLQRELYEPFAKYLAIFSRRSTDDARMKYDLAVEAYKRFTAGVASMSREVAQSPVNTSLPNIYKSLGNLAQETSLWKDAIQWNVDATHLLNETSTRSLVQNACFCRLTFLHLQLVLAGNHVDGFKASLLQATTCLEGSLHGDSAELDELLMAVAPLRKAAMTFMIRSPPSKNEVGDIDQEMQSTRLLCSELVHVCLKFFIRYIGSAPRGKQAAKALIRYEQRQKFSSLAARSAIESVIACTKISLGTDHISWDKLDSPLQDCARLLLVLDPLPTNTDDAPKTPPDKELLIVKLSNVYWSYYLKRKQALGAPRELAKSLQRSVELLQNRTKLEKTAGFLAIKLERLGALQESLGRMSDALNLFAEAARSHIDDAVLCNAASAAKTRPLLDVWEGGGAIGVFGKAVSSWTKVAVQDASTSEIPFDYGVPSTEERGLLLEWQLTVLSNLLDTQAATERHIRSIRILADNLLEIYGAETFPIRRLRLILCLLRIESNHTDILGQVFMGKLSEESGEQLLKVSTTEDRGLARYEIHLKACVTASLALRNDKSSEEGLRSALSLWIGVLDSCETWHCISEKVENGSNWILQLQSILDYLDMQGLETLRVSALHLMAKVRELQEPLECSALVRSMSDLGLQYLRLGYSGRAGHALVRAVNYVETWDVSIEVKLQWYLAYAEYLVEIGNSEKW